MADMFFKVVTPFNTYYVRVDYWEDEMAEDEIKLYYHMRIYDENPKSKKKWWSSPIEPIWEYGKCKADRSPRCKAIEVIDKLETPYRHQEEMEHLGYTVWHGVEPEPVKEKYPVRVTNSWVDEDEEREKIIYLERGSQI